MKTTHSAAFVIGLLVMLNACVTAPTNGELVTPHNPIHFSGYVSSPDSTVEIKAYNKLQNTWLTVGSATSELTGTNLNGDTLYFWHTDVLFTALPQWQCYWGSETVGLECSIPPGSASAQFKINQADGINLTTFERGFFPCITQKFDEGKGGIAAGFECRSPSSPILHLIWIT